METVPVSDFFSSLRKIVNVPLEFMMAESIVKAAQTFCRKSKEVIYTRSLGTIEVLTDYNLISDSELNDPNTILKSVEIINMSGIDSDSDSPRYLKRGVDYVIVSRDVIYFNESFTDVKVRCAIEPVQDVSVLPKVLFDDYLDGICSGAASLLLAQPDSDWGDGNLSQYHDRLFIESIVEARRFRLDANPQEQDIARPTINRSFY